MPLYVVLRQINDGDADSVISGGRTTVIGYPANISRRRIDWNGSAIGRNPWRCYAATGDHRPSKMARHGQTFPANTDLSILFVSDITGQLVWLSTFHRATTIIRSSGPF